MPKAKTTNIKITKTFEINPGSKYLVVLPKDIFNDSNVYPQLVNLFKDSAFVGLALKKPSDVKCFEIK